MPYWIDVDRERAVVGLPRFDEERESSLVARPEDVGPQAAIDLLDRPTAGIDAEGLAKIFHAAAGDHLGLAGRDRDAKITAARQAICAA